MNMFSTQRLPLRPLHVSDFPVSCDDFFGSDAAIAIGGSRSDRESRTRFSAMDGHWALNDFGWFMVADGDSPAGVAGARPVRAGMELGRIVCPPAGRRGYAAEAASAAPDAASTTLCPDRIVSYIDRTSAASQWCARRLGARMDSTRALDDPEGGTRAHEGTA